LIEIAATAPSLSKRQMQHSQIDVYGTSVRVGIWPGDRKRTPLILFNGIGSSLELLAPFADTLGDIETIAFDAPGTGESSDPPIPYRLWMLSMFVSKLLTKLGYDRVDALGVSWGGALAQQFALMNPRRCRRLVLAATSQGFLMKPGKLSVLAKFMTPRRFNDADYRKAIAADIYGGKARHQNDSIHEFRKTSKGGYLLQQLALLGWTSVPWLPLLRQPTLVMAGDDDPIIPLVNAKLLSGLIRDSRLHIVNDGHLFLISAAEESGRVVREFLLADEGKSQ
jgi:poly(3-hydroxyalkanoate) depolymerase